MDKKLSLELSLFYPALLRPLIARSILEENLNADSCSATRELNKLQSRKAGQLYSRAWHCEIDGRKRAGCSML